MPATRLAVSPLALAALLAVPSISNPPRRELTTGDYDRAVKMLGFNLDSLVVGGKVTATWLPDDRFYYRTTTPAGSEWLLVDPAHHTQQPLFNADAVAQALAHAGAGTFDGKQLSSDGDYITVEI